MAAQDKGHQRAEDQRLKHDGGVQRSLQELIKDDHLFVHPLDWTNQHLHALQCQFESKRVAIARVEDTLVSTLRSKFGDKLLDDLFSLQRREETRTKKDNALRWIVEQMARKFLPMNQVTRA